MAFNYKLPVVNKQANGSISFYKGLRIDRGYNNTRYFSTLEEQNAYFSDSHTGDKLTFSNYAIKDPNSGQIKVGCARSALEGYDYCRFKSVNSERWTYAFITNIQYSSPNTCIVSVEIDAIQTCMGFWDLGQQQIERLTHIDSPNDYFDMEDPQKPNTSTVYETGKLISLNSYNILIVSSCFPSYMRYNPDTHQFDPESETYQGETINVSRANTGYWIGYGRYETEFWVNPADNAKGNSSLFLTRIKGISEYRKNGQGQYYEYDTSEAAKVRATNNVLREVLRTYANDYLVDPHAGDDTWDRGWPNDRTKSIKAIYCVPDEIFDGDPQYQYVGGQSTLSRCIKYTGVNPDDADSPIFKAMISVMVPGVKQVVFDSTQAVGTALRYEKIYHLPDFSELNIHNDKTNDSLEIRISSRNGQSVTIPREQYRRLKDVVIKAYGICGVNPAIVLEVRTYNSDTPGESNRYFTDNPFLITITGWPSIGTIDTAADRIWDRSYRDAQMTNSINLGGNLINGFSQLLSMGFAGSAADIVSGGPNVDPNQAVFAGAFDPGVVYKSPGELTPTGAYTTVGSLGSTAMKVGSGVTNAITTDVTYRSSRPFTTIGTSSNDIIYYSNICDIIVDVLGPEHLKLKAYDQYLTAFGYFYGGLYEDLTYLPMNEMNYCFVKTVNASIGGDIGIYKPVIDAAFNKGIRFWSTDIGTYWEDTPLGG